MDDMYNNSNTNEENGGSAYEEAGTAQENGGYQQPYQPTVQEQLQYQYQQPDDEREEPVTMGEWVISLLIMMIPCVNIIMAFVWAFSSKEKKSKSNYFKAYLIFMAIQIVLSVVLMIVYFVFLGAVISSVGGYSY